MLPIGYSADAFPHFYYHKPEDEFKGVVLELWNTLSRQFGCSGLELVKYDKQSEFVLSFEFILLIKLLMEMIVSSTMEPSFAVKYSPLLTLCG